MNFISAPQIHTHTHTHGHRLQSAPFCQSYIRTYVHTYVCKPHGTLRANVSRWPTVCTGCLFEYAKYICAVINTLQDILHILCAVAQANRTKLNNVASRCTETTGNMHAHMHTFIHVYICAHAPVRGRGHC